MVSVVVFFFVTLQIFLFGFFFYEWCFFPPRLFFCSFKFFQESYEINTISSLEKLDFVDFKLNLLEQNFDSADSTFIFLQSDYRQFLSELNCFFKVSFFKFFENDFLIENFYESNITNFLSFRNYSNFFNYLVYLFSNSGCHFLNISPLEGEIPPMDDIQKPFSLFMENGQGNSNDGKTLGWVDNSVPAQQPHSLNGANRLARNVLARFAVMDERFNINFVEKMRSLDEHTRNFAFRNQAEWHAR
jgi:hypothetical protein